MEVLCGWVGCRGEGFKVGGHGEGFRAGAGQKQVFLHGGGWYRRGGAGEFRAVDYVLIFDLFGFGTGQVEIQWIYPLDREERLR